MKYCMDPKRKESSLAREAWEEPQRRQHNHVLWMNKHFLDNWTGGGAGGKRFEVTEVKIGLYDGELAHRYPLWEHLVPWIEK